MKILLIFPGIEHGVTTHNERGGWAPILFGYPAITLPHLAALVPKKHEVEIQSLSFSEFDLIDNNTPNKKEKAKKSSLSFNLSFQTSWEKTKAFLSDLEKLERLSKLKNLKQSSVKNQGDIVSTTIEANIYFFRENGIL